MEPACKCYAMGCLMPKEVGNQNGKVVARLLFAHSSNLCNTHLLEGRFFCFFFLQIHANSGTHGNKTDVIINKFMIELFIKPCTHSISVPYKQQITQGWPKTAPPQT